MHGCNAGNDGVIFHRDVAGEPDGVRKDDVITELAVVGNVGVAEQQIVRADPSRKFFMSATMDGAVFAKDIVVPDFESGGLADVFEVLGFSADDREWEKFVAAPKHRVPFKHDMRVEHAIRAQSYIRADDAIWADAHVAAESGLRGNNGGGVDHERSFGSSWRM